MASVTSATASVSAGDSSARRSHNSSMLAWRSAMPHHSEALPHQCQPFHRLDHGHPDMPGAGVAIEVPGADQDPAVGGQGLGHDPGIAPAAGGHGHPEV